ncbi:hypothetical protein [Absidia glauca]|uniref:F-box domain-containing protein n=1 Tax=Absidia glauca TaxID=4829 RepID=A0A168QMX2_ABSGL|nr:hypothetical protein [Absidia glauca]
MSFFHQLPFETLSTIVSYICNPQDLYQCTLTSTAFYKLANPKLWHAPTDVTTTSYYEFARTLLNDNQIDNLRSLPLGHYIRRLDLSFALTDLGYSAGVRLLFTYTPLLEILTIDLSGPIRSFRHKYREAKPVSKNLLLLCPRLRVVSRTDRYLNFLKALGHCHQLHTLHLVDTDIIFDGLWNLRHCPLESLSVKSMTWTAHDKLHDLHQFTRLSSLKITTNDRYDIVDRLLFLSPPQQSTILVFPCLKTLHLHCHGSDGVSTRTLVHILTTYPQLQELSILVIKLTIIQGPVFPHLNSLILEDFDRSTDGAASLLTAEVFRNTRNEAVRSWIHACPALTDFNYEAFWHLDERYLYDTLDMQRIRSGGPL